MVRSRTPLFGLIVVRPCDSGSLRVRQNQWYTVRVGGDLENRGSGVLHSTLTPDPPPCPADFNADGFLDFFDDDAFVAAFESGC